MRKASREMDAFFAFEIFDKAPYVTVSMTRKDGAPYGIPLSLVRTDDKTFYFHCAMEGDKLDCIAHNPIVFLLRLVQKMEASRFNTSQPLLWARQSWLLLVMKRLLR